MATISKLITIQPEKWKWADHIALSSTLNAVLTQVYLNSHVSTFCSMNFLSFPKYPTKSRRNTFSSKSEDCSGRFYFDNTREKCGRIKDSSQFDTLIRAELFNRIMFYKLLIKFITINKRTTTHHTLTMHLCFE